jgi:hypothetical protein
MNDLVMVTNGVWSTFYISTLLYFPQINVSRTLAPANFPWYHKAFHTRYKGASIPVQAYYRPLGF